MADWHTRAIIYQIDSALFYDFNGDGCGDIAGITAKLRYIRRMGATVIWITPFYLTPFLDEGYDVSDTCRSIRDLVNWRISSPLSSRPAN
ncbi:Oligo-1,6-glucosidase [Klebsiella pasteurii]|nr:Oligo-1,6-glucosidase [Klebsiella pasteurii]